MCAHYKVCTGDRAWKAIGDRLQAPSYLNRFDHYWKIGARKQRTDIAKIVAYVYKYMIQEETAILWEMIVCVILSKKVHINTGPILNGYRDTACVRIKDRSHELLRATRCTLQRVHKCIEVGGGIFKNLL
jgi:hypothetical protein